MELTNEYLIILDEKTSSGIYKLCTSTLTFNKLIVADNKNIEIKKGKIASKALECKYKIKQGEVKEKKQKYFYITISFNDEEQKLDSFNNLLSYIKYTLTRDGADIETLRDDLSFYYSQLAYSKVHKIENLMRKFITYFMITNLGKNWIDESSPKQIKEALEKSKRKDYMDKLQQLDFIHLGDLLFKSFQEKDLFKLSDMIKNTNEKSILIENIQDFIPMSNWDKYFKDIVDCDDKFLKERWSTLYEFRNKIAHSSNFSKEDYLNIEDLVNDIENKLNKAFESIDSIEMNMEDKELLSENLAININEDIGKFLKEWNEYEKTIKFIYKIEDGDNNKFINKLKTILKKEFDEKTYKEINLLRSYKNNLVHNIEVDKKEDILNNIERIRNILTSTWKIQVLNAFRSLNGEATLNEVYQFIKKNTGKNLTTSGEASIRKAIYFHSSDADIFQEKEDLFKKLGNGRWQLREA